MSRRPWFSAAVRRLFGAADFALMVAIGLVVAHHAFNGGPFGKRPFELARGREEVPPSAFVFLRGDANDDGEVNISDAVHALNYLFLGGRKPPCLAAADADDGGSVDLSDATFTLNFLFLGGPELPLPYPEPGLDPTPDLECREPPLPPLVYGSPGGPDRELTLEEEFSWRRGQRFFDTPARVAEGLGRVFNGDSCRACHLDPVIGGAGGLDVDVVRFARVEGGVVAQLGGGPAASQHSILELEREEAPPEANVIETRQTPTLLGLGLVDRIPRGCSWRTPIRTMPTAMASRGGRGWWTSGAAPSASAASGTRPECPASLTSPPTGFSTRSA